MKHIDMSIYPSASGCVPSSLPSVFATACREPALIGSSAAIRGLRLQVARIGPHFRTALLRGEDATGTEQLGRALHELSQGAAGQFVCCDAATLGDVLLNTSPEDSLAWLTRMAGGGTLFLHGVEQMPPAAQAELLVLLRRHECVGDAVEAAQRPDLRVIAATGEDLKTLASVSRFSHELYRHLATVEIVLPALRERKEDLPDLVRVLLERQSSAWGTSLTVSKVAMERLTGYAWPGGLRELADVLRNAAAKSEGGPIESQHLPAFAERRDGPKPETEESVLLQNVLERHVMRVLLDCGGNKLRAAERLGISRSTLYRMLESVAAAHVSR